VNKFISIAALAALAATTAIGTRGCAVARDWVR
jgi:hypothetical protein